MSAYLTSLGATIVDVDGPGMALFAVLDMLCSIGTCVPLTAGVTGSCVMTSLDDSDGMLTHSVENRNKSKEQAERKFKTTLPTKKDNLHQDNP